MSTRGLPTGVGLRHDTHYVDTLSTSNRSIGKTIPIDKIAPNPEQPRTEFGDLTDLSASIKEKGVLEPLLVKPNGDGTYMIIAGERRWRASKLAGLKELPCIEMDLDEQSIAEIALIENMQRKDLNVWEEADGLAALSERYGYTHDDIAKKISKSRSTVTEFLTIAGLSSEIRERCVELKINTKSGLLEVARQFDDQAIFEFLDKVESGEKPPKQQKTVPTKAASKTSIIKNRNETTPFVFNSTNGFELTIKFENDGFDKVAILTALKETFESVKNKDAGK